MMNTDRPIGTKFTLDDGRMVMLVAHEWDGRVRLQVCSWPDGWESKAKSANRQRAVYMTRSAFTKRARVWPAEIATTGRKEASREPGDIMHN